MRVATAGLYHQVLDAIGRNQSDVARLQLQVATGKRILTPADDPFGASRGMQLRNAIDQLAKFDENGSRAMHRLGLEDGALSQVVNTLQRINELAVRSNNATETDDTRVAVVAELKEILGQLVEIANATDGEGGYLFAGYRSGTKPFEYDAATGVTYNGDQGQRMLQIGPSRQVADGDPGFDVFLAIPNGNGTFVTTAADTNTGSAIADGGSVTDLTQWDRGTYTIAFTSETDYEVRDATNTVIATGSFADDEDHVVSFRGISIGIQGTPAAGDQFTVEPSSKQDIFQTVQDFIDALETGAGDEASSTLLHNRLNNVLANLDQAFGHFARIHASVGTRLNAVDNQADMNAQYSILLQGTAGEIEDVDMAKTISQLDLKLVTLQASEQAFVAVQRLSLFSFL